MKTMLDSGGKSAVSGLKQLLRRHDQEWRFAVLGRHPKFKVGENLANAKGNVVFRNEVLELIHYTADDREGAPAAAPCRAAADQQILLGRPGAGQESMIRFLLANGIQPYCVSWRNPTAEQADWGLDTYIEALDEACDAARDITGADTVNIMGSCSGGITLSTYVAWLAAQKKEKINAVILAVCVLDTQADTDSEFASLVTPER